MGLIKPATHRDWRNHFGFGFLWLGKLRMEGYYSNNDTFFFVFFLTNLVYHHYIFFFLFLLSKFCTSFTKSFYFYSIPFAFPYSLYSLSKIHSILFRCQRIRITFFSATKRSAQRLKWESLDNDLSLHA